VPEERDSRCVLHPGSPTVARCDECGAGLCLTCAVPVRGKVLGPECLPEVLGDRVPPPPVVRQPRVRLAMAGLGFAIAVVASAFPWKRYGLGSGPFGAWGFTLRWSILAAVAAALGLAVWALVSVAGLKPGSAWRGASRALAVLVGAAAILHLLRRPGFGPQSVGPWMAILGAAVALAGASARAPGQPGTPEVDGPPRRAENRRDRVGEGRKE